ncbi:MAG TPA: hypothetical protein PK929_04790 [Quisquiliibacterium sp.]|nr:hypothetical protein [Quisquiliibacterium sp.]
MTENTPLLFTPRSLRGLTLRNRIVLSPMLTYAARHGFASDWHFTHLAKYAVGGGRPGVRRVHQGRSGRLLDAQ